MEKQKFYDNSKGIRKIMFIIYQAVLIWKRNRLISKGSKGSKVIGDFGCGHFPSKYANAFIDNRDISDEQRGGYTLYKGDNFYDVDLNTYPWPFKDKQFDFAICTHLLEHLDDPIMACKELSRVAKAGYIEVPHWCHDIFIGNDKIHKSLISYDGETLTFTNREKFLSLMIPDLKNVFYRYIVGFIIIRVMWRDGIKTKLVKIN